MKKWIALLLCLCLMAAAPLSLAEEGKTLNVLSFAGYVDDGVLADFEAETGIKVVWSPADSYEDILLKVTQSGGEGYDLVLTADYSLDIMRQEGLLQKLDMAKLSNFSNLNPVYLNQFFDPDNEYAVPYICGCTLIVYNPELCPVEITGYEDLWNEALKDSVVTLDSSRVLIGVTLKTLGYGMNETDPAILAKAKEKLMPLYPNIRAFGDMESFSALESGEASVGFIFAAFATMLHNEFPDYKIVYPKEGLGFGIDGFVMTAAAKNVDNAHAFLNYLMEPEVAAHNTEYQGYTCVNKAAEDYLSAQYWDNPAVCIPEENLKTAEIVQNIGSAESLYTDIYTAFKLQ